jgi:predicted RNA-binding Zn-ribbon protein involved in translation (DUF1610 family)
MPTRTDQKFPCPVCTHTLDVRLTKKNKPYVTCDACGVQLFVRGPKGIEEFNRLIARGTQNGILGRLREMEQRYRLNCPHCGATFWIERGLIKTSAFDGSFRGFECPKCREIVPWEGKR